VSLIGCHRGDVSLLSTSRHSLMVSLHFCDLFLHENEAVFEGPTAVMTLPETPNLVDESKVAARIARIHVLQHIRDLSTPPWCLLC
jgi:hypothetical protein